MINIFDKLFPSYGGKVITDSKYIKDAVKNKNLEDVVKDIDNELARQQGEISALHSGNYVTVTAEGGDTSVEDIMTREGITPAVDTIYRIGAWDGTQYDDTAYSEYSWNQDDGYKFIATHKEKGIDTDPTAGSHNLVESGGVQNELALGAVYDVSAKNPTSGPNNDGKWESLSALLSDANLNTLIPTSVRKGGMSVKFVQSSDNKYVQFFCKAQSFTTDISEWEKTNLESELNLLNNKVIDGLGGTIIREGATANRGLTIGGGFKKGDIVEIQLTDGAATKRVSMYQDAWGGTVVGRMESSTFTYEVPNDFTSIVFYNDNYASGYSISLSIIRDGELSKVRELIIPKVVEDTRNISTSSNLDDAARFPISSLGGYNKIKIKVENIIGVASQWSLYCINNGYKKILDSSVFGEYIEATIPSAATYFGIYVFSSNVTTSGTIKVSYQFASYVDKEINDVSDRVNTLEEQTEDLFEHTLRYSGTTQNRSLTISGDYKTGDVIDITILNDVAESHLFTLYQNEWGGKLIDRPTTTTFQYVAPNDFSAIVFYNDNSAAGYDVEITVTKQGEIQDMEDAISELETFVGTVDSVDRLITLNTNPLSVIRRDAGFAAMFLKWGFVGDSLSSGCHNVHIGGEATSVDFYDFSWGQFICRLCGTEGYNFSFGGQSALGWITNTKGDGVTPISDELKLRTWDGAKTNLKDAYTIAFGVNDVNVETSVGDASTDIGVYNSATDTDTNANTFAGHYAGVIQRIKSVQPKAKIFCITMPQGDQGHAEAYSNVIRSMANYFDDVYIIDLYTYAPVIGVDWSYRYRQQYHLNAAGYLWTAYEIMTYIDWIVRNNWRAFNNVAFIGTDYTES